MEVSIVYASFFIFTIFDVFCILIQSLGCVNLGGVLYFPSAFSNDLERYNTTIYEGFIAVSEEEEDKIGSFIGLGALIGNILLSFLGNSVGRKTLTIQLGVIGIVSWLGLALSHSVTSILVFRLSSGILLGIQPLMKVIYIVEIADATIRGTFGIFSTVLLLSGNVLSALLNYWVRYYTSALISLAIPFLQTIGAIFIVESPSYLVIKGKEGEAREIINRLRSKDWDADKEIDVYKKKNEVESGKTVWRGLGESSVIKRILSLLVLFLIRDFAGFSIMTFYSGRIISSWNTGFDEDIVSAILYALQIPTTLLLSFRLIERIGRKKCLQLSCFIVALSMLILSAHSFFHNDSEMYSANESIDFVVNDTISNTQLYNATNGNEEVEACSWFLKLLPLVATWLCFSGYYLGLQGIPFLLATEYFPTWLRPQAGAICMLFFSLCAFTTLRLYSAGIEYLSQAGFYLFMGTAAVTGIPYIQYFIQETMGGYIG